MKWKDILKNVITQGKIKEIEDIDIDIEDDDCKRWLQRFSNEMKSFTPSYKNHPKIKELGDFNSVTEEEACALKGLILNEIQPTDMGQLNSSPYVSRYITDNVDVTFEFFTTMSFNEFGYYVFLTVAERDSSKPIPSTNYKVKWGIGFSLPRIFIGQLKTSIVDFESINDFVDAYIAPMEKMVDRLRKYTNQEYFYTQFKKSMLIAIKKAIQAFISNMKEQGYNISGTMDAFNSKDYSNIYDKAFKR